MGLPDYYRACNEEEGHARNCGWGAGGDCTCGKFNVEAGHARNCGYGMQEECCCAKRPIMWLYGQLADIRGNRKREAAIKAALEDDLPF